jgi:hypothetical protein
MAETVIHCEQSGTQAIAQALTCQFECIRRLLMYRIQAYSAMFTAGQIEHHPVRNPAVGSFV